MNGVLDCHQRFGAFVPDDDTRRLGQRAGTLHRLTFAAKDLFDVAGTVTGCGNPDWASTHGPAASSAWAVQALLDAGADLLGKTITDEISLGLLGINRHQGTPLNPRASDRVPGGSSSGSASAVAGEMVDIALGTDSGGSVRVPASFCGLYGLRPTYGQISVDGLMTQSPSFDTVGFFTRDAATFARTAAVLLGGRVAPQLPAEIVLAADCFAIADPEVQAALDPVVARLRSTLARMSEVRLAKNGLAEWACQQRRLQSDEFGRTFAAWIDACNPRFSFEVAGALASAAHLSPAEAAAGRGFREYARRRIESILNGRRVLLLPTTPILPILRDARLSEMNLAVDRLVELTCIAGLTGLPQVNLPFAWAGSIPVGVSLIGWGGSDLQLIGMAQALEQTGFASPQPEG